MQSPQSLPWTEPLELASGIDEPCWVLLYSAAKTSYSGRYSYLACQLSQHISGNDFSALDGKLTADRTTFDNAWFGYFGYGLKDSLEQLVADSPNIYPLPHLQMMQFDTILQFDHEARKLTLFSKSDKPFIPQATNRIAKPLPAVSSIQSNMSRTAYLDKVGRIIECIHKGDLYQANLTRKFSGQFSESPDAFSLFRKLCSVSPAPYSAFLRMHDTCVLSSSPEMFLKIGPEGTIRARPIKGTSPRFSDPVKDKQSLNFLAHSVKDRAENLMIVDLMRNDLSRSCVPGSVQAEHLFEVTSHAAVHHMSSTVTGQKKPGCTALDTLKYAFPPGSMTGAPKIRAMNLCSEMEILERGIYSGAIGWLGGDGSAELSVVIRTLVLNGSHFEFQVGGGIVADSIPEQELMETIDKSRGILSALNIPATELERL